MPMGEIDWGKIGTNVLNSLATKLPDIGISALSAAILPRVETAKQTVAAANVSPATTTIVQQVPGQGTDWSKYVPYGIGGAVLLGAVYMLTRRKGSAA